MTTAGPVLGEERRSDEFFDSLDHVIDIHGHIIGMGLSPDHRRARRGGRAGFGCCGVGGSCSGAAGGSRGRRDCGEGAGCLHRLLCSFTPRLSPRADGVCMA